MQTYDKSRVYGRIAALLRFPAERIADETVLTDLVTDSFVLVEMVVELQEEFGVQFVQEDLGRVTTFGDLAHLVEDRLGGKAGGT